MESGRGRFRRGDEMGDARRELRSEIRGLRRELELLDDVLDAGPTPLSARAALDHAFFNLRGAEREWRSSREHADLHAVVRQLEGTRDALEASLEALRRRAARAGR